MSVPLRKMEGGRGERTPVAVCLMILPFKIPCYDMVGISMKLPEMYEESGVIDTLSILAVSLLPVSFTVQRELQPSQKPV